VLELFANVLWRCQISVNHRYVYNAIYDNLAFAINRSTIFLKSAKFDFHDNFLVNPYNLYEMVTFNRTRYVSVVLCEFQTFLLLCFYFVQLAKYSLLFYNVY